MLLISFVISLNFICAECKYISSQNETNYTAFSNHHQDFDSKVILDSVLLLNISNEVNKLSKHSDLISIPKSQLHLTIIDPNPATTSKTEENNKSQAILTSGKETTAGIWCYCNLASCVPKGYMCRSALGACYSKNIEQSVQTHHRSQFFNVYDISANALSRGCAEFLSERELRRCILELYPFGESDSRLLKTSGIKNHEEGAADDDAEGDETDLQCCRQDVCNYEVSQPVFVVRKADESGSSSLLNSHFDWFKTTTVVVTVTGVCILCLLVVFVGRMLSSDAKTLPYRYQNGRSINSKAAAIYFEAALPTSDSGSILCAKRLQRNDHITNLCSIHRTTKSTNHPNRTVSRNLPTMRTYSFSDPVSPSSCSSVATSQISMVTRTCDLDAATLEEKEPLSNEQHFEHFLLDTSFPT